MDRNTTATGKISLIVPVYNESAGINDTIAHVRRVAGGDPIEIIVADGGPGHATLSTLNDPAALSVRCQPGRGRQMNAGAALASGDILLFLHADTRLPEFALAAVREAIHQGNAAGAFSLAIDSERLDLGFIAFFANLRSRLERIPYGDQAQFIRTDEFHRLGGFAEIPIMEDVDLFRRIRRRGLPIVILKRKVRTSSRRWENEGALRRTLTNWWLRIRFALGASPEKLARHYHPPGTKAD